MTGNHAKAVLFMCDRLAASGLSVISANTDERADPQIFAQSDSGELAFYFVRADAPAPTPADRGRFLALAGKHDVSAYYAAVTLGSTPAAAVSRL